MNGLGGVGFEVATEANDEVVDGAGVGVFFDVPDIFEQLGAGDDLVGVIEKIAQEIGFHEGEMDGFFLRGIGIARADFEVVEIDDAAGQRVGGRWFGGGWLCGGGCDGEGGLPVHAAKEGGEAGEEDAEVEGLGEVVVGTGSEAFDDVLRRGRGR